MAELSNYDGNHVDHRVENIYQRAFHGKSLLSPDLVSLRPPTKSTGCTGVSHEWSGAFDLRYQCSRGLAENLNSILVREEVLCEFAVCHVHVGCACTSTLACVCKRLQMHPYKCDINGTHLRRQGS